MLATGSSACHCCAPSIPLHQYGWSQAWSGCMVLGWGCHYRLLCPGARGGRACRWCQDSISITTNSWPVSQWRWQHALSWLVTLVSLSPPWSPCPPRLWRGLEHPEFDPAVLVLHSISSLHPASPCPACFCCLQAHLPLLPRSGCSHPPPSLLARPHLALATAGLAPSSLEPSCHPLMNRLSSRVRAL